MSNNPLKSKATVPAYAGGYFVMINHDQSCAHCATLDEARVKGQLLCDAEPVPATFSIQDADGQHIEDIKRTDGRDLSHQIADFKSTNG